MDYKISIEELENTSSKTINFHFEDKIDGLSCVTPIVADLEIKSLGEFIEIGGNVKGTVKLECDLCLKEDRKSTRLNSSHITRSRMPSSA